MKPSLELSIEPSNEELCRFKATVEEIDRLADLDVHGSPNYRHLDMLLNRIRLVTGLLDGKKALTEFSLDDTKLSLETYLCTEEGKKLRERYWGMNTAFVDNAIERIWNRYNPQSTCWTVMEGELRMEEICAKALGTEIAQIESKYKACIDAAQDIEKKINAHLAGQDETLTRLTKDLSEGIQRTIESYEILMENSRKIDIYQAKVRNRPLILPEDVRPCLEEWQKYQDFINYIPDLEIGYKPIDSPKIRYDAINDIAEHDGLRLRQMIKNWTISRKSERLLKMLEWIYHHDPMPIVTMAANSAYIKLTNYNKSLDKDSI